MTSFTKKFIQTFNNIRSLSIQGAENITHEGSKATVLQIIRDIERVPDESYNGSLYREICTEAASKMLSARPTEPHLANSIMIVIGNDNPKTKEDALKKLQKGLAFIESHHESVHSQVTASAKKELSKFSSVYTHCHSSFVREAIMGCGIKIVYNTETRPRFQGRITAQKLAGYGIVHHYVDSGMNIAVEKADVILLGADSITVRGDVINKIGSGMLGIIAKYHKKPIYIVTDTLKLDTNSLKKDTAIEERSVKEVWNANIPGLYIHNPAFELLKSEFITGIICEKGVFSPKDFVKVASKEIQSKLKN